MNTLHRAMTLGLLCLALGGCAGLPRQAARAPSQVLPAGPEAALVQAAAGVGLAPGRSGFRALPQAEHALDARLELIRRAEVSLDLQYYLVGDDATGHAVLAALRDAALRGVRVRLLVDDFHTLGLDDLLLGLAAYPGVEVRVFNPFASGRGNGLGRLVGLAADFRRLNHRMHNKLFIADGVFAIAGGRNLADAYFLRDADANFIDLDMLMAGAIVPQLGAWFDRYWNCELVYPIGALADDGLAPPQRREHFDARVALDTARPRPVPGRDLLNQVPLGAALDHAPLEMTSADAGAFADTPSKADDAAQGGGEPSVTARLFNGLRGAQQEVVLFSPYFIPGEHGLRQLGALQQRGVRVSVVTNSLASSDEPLASIAYGRYRSDLLRAGVRLFELSPEGLQRDPVTRKALGGTRGRLHAKLGFVDRHLVLVGSLNLDPRSARSNTELGIVIDSAELAGQLSGLFDLDRAAGLVEVQLAPDGSGLQRLAHGRTEAGAADAEDAAPPDTSPWQRLRLFLLSHLVPEDLL
jgi:phosphatidylserine/phosphatidylglycerophosphate/cardiolipin synthase-like enzyme